MENARSMGLGLVPVKLDSQGPIPSALDHMLDEWNEDAHGPKPRVFYTVTTGQNPTGTTASLERLKDLYAIAQKHDLILIADDPYFFLQLGDYKGRSSSLKLRRSPSSFEELHIAGNPPKKNAHSSLEQLAKTLSPTLLSIDTDGRVAQCDSFSKIVFPNARLGWVTLNPLFKERYERLSEVTTQMGTGPNQAFFAQLLTDPSPTIF